MCSNSTDVLSDKVANPNSNHATDIRIHSYYARSYRRPFNRAVPQPQQLQLPTKCTLCTNPPKLVKRCLSLFSYTENCRRVPLNDFIYFHVTKRVPRGQLDGGSKALGRTIPCCGPAFTQSVGVQIQRAVHKPALPLSCSTPL